MRSERLTKIFPSRRRIVVFSEVKRLNRMEIWGMGARGRNTRYSSWKTATISTATKMEVSTTGRAEAAL
jgi:hypothetical protein